MYRKWWLERHWRYDTAEEIFNEIEIQKLKRDWEDGDMWGGLNDLNIEFFPEYVSMNGFKMPGQVKRIERLEKVLSKDVGQWVDKKVKKKNIFSAIGLVVFILFLFIFTLYNVGVFERVI